MEATHAAHSHALCCLFSFCPVCGSAAFAHDIWINRGGLKNPAGEWCCGAEDCGVVSPKAVHAGQRRLFGASAP